MAGDNTQEVMTSSVEEVSWEDFLSNRPPGRVYSVKGMAKRSNVSRRSDVDFPDLTLYCESEDCNGERIFEHQGGSTYLWDGVPAFDLIKYRCKNCEKTEKAISVVLYVSPAESVSEAAKLGEWPPFGPHVPSRLITLIGPDRDLFLKGRRVEAQALGIGAFAYYRRVVENQKGRLLDQIISAAERLNLPPADISKLRAATQEHQFTKALEIMKPAIPEAVKIKGHNPLQLLHQALSEGLHEKTDAECLELATSIRVVLTKLAEKLSEVLKDQAELDSAVSRLARSGDQPRNGKS